MAEIMERALDIALAKKDLKRKRARDSNGSRGTGTISDRNLARASKATGWGRSYQARNYLS